MTTSVLLHGRTVVSCGTMYHVAQSGSSFHKLEPPTGSSNRWQCEKRTVSKPLPFFFANKSSTVQNILTVFKVFKFAQ